MKVAGYNVPQDGSWGPYQQKIWDKLNTREKEYKPTIWGLLQKGYDTITGNTTYQAVQPTITATSGDPDRSRKTKAQRNADYWHPIYGASKRWKTSMSNDTNPFVGLGRTVVPAVAGALALEYLPVLLSKTATALPYVAKVVTSHPNMTAQIVKHGATKVGKAFVKGAIGGKAVDMASEGFTGNTFGENLAPYIGTSSETADWLNPGYLLGGKSWGFTKRYNDIKASKVLKNKAKEKLQQADNIMEEAEKRYRTLQEEYHTLYKAKEEANRIVDDKANKLREAEDVVRNLAPLEYDYRHLVKRNHNFRKAVISSEAPLENSEVYYRVGELPFKADTQISKTSKSSKIKFKAPNVESEAEINYTIPSTGFTLSSTTINMPYTPKGLRLGMVRGHTSSRFGTILEGDTKQLQEGISKYVDDLHNIMGEEGTVAGSLIHYKNGVLKGTQRGEEFIGPADTEIYTTAQRYPELIKRLQFEERANNSTGGHKGVSPYTFRNTDSAHNGLDTEINIIEADDKGMARGKIAHQIYRALWPEKYSKISYDHTMSGNVTPTSEISLPVTAEDLLQTIRKDPEAMQTHLLTDLVGMETFTNPKHTKATKRLYSILFDPDQTTARRLDNALRIHGKYNMGSNFKQGTELYPNLTFNDKNANKEFLMKVYQLTQEEAEKLASNPDVMRNAFNLYNFSMSTNTRMVGNDVLTDEISGQLWHDPKIEMFTGNGAFSGGTASGAGLNTTLLNPYGGWRVGKTRGGKPMNVVGIAQRPLTYHPDNIITPLDLFNQVEKLKRVNHSPYYSGELATFNTNEPIKYNTNEMARISQISEANDEPVLLGMNRSTFGWYSGGIAKPLATGARTVSERDAPELGSLLLDINQSSGTSAIMLKEQTPRHIQKYLTDIEHGGNRYLDLFKNYWKNATLKERGQLLSFRSWYPKGKYYIKLDDKYDPIKRTSTSYRTSDITINGVKYNPYKIIADMADLDYQYNSMIKSGYSSTDEAMIKNRQRISELNRRWQQFMTYYKTARKNKYNANQELEKANKVYNKAQRIASKHFSKANKAFKEYNTTYIQRRTAYNDYDRAKNLYRENKQFLKEHLWKFGAMGIPGFLTIGLPNLVRYQNRQFDKNAALEQAGKMDPTNGYYKAALYDELNGNQVEVNKKVEEAKKKYETKSKNK